MEITAVPCTMKNMSQEMLFTTATAKSLSMTAQGTMDSAIWEKGKTMTDNIMFIPAIVVLVLEAVAFTFLVWSWFDAKRKGSEEDESSRNPPV